MNTKALIATTVSLSICLASCETISSGSSPGILDSVKKALQLPPLGGPTSTTEPPAANPDAAEFGAAVEADTRPLLRYYVYRQGGRQNVDNYMRDAWAGSCNAVDVFTRASVRSQAEEELFASPPDQNFYIGVRAVIGPYDYNKRQFPLISWSAGGRYSYTASERTLDPATTPGKDLFEMDNLVVNANSPTGGSRPFVGALNVTDIHADCVPQGAQLGPGLYTVSFPGIADSRLHYLQTDEATAKTWLAGGGPSYINIDILFTISKISIVPFTDPHMFQLWGGQGTQMQFTGKPQKYVLWAVWRQGSGHAPEKLTVIDAR